MPVRDTGRRWAIGIEWLWVVACGVVGVVAALAYDSPLLAMCGTASVLAGLIGDVLTSRREGDR